MSKLSANVPADGQLAVKYCLRLMPPILAHRGARVKSAVRPTPYPASAIPNCVRRSILITLRVEVINMKGTFVTTAVCIIMLLTNPVAATQPAYSNATAEPAGGTICKIDADCSPSDFCRYEPGACGGEGICTWRPEGCAAVMDPICGCDGRTYSNSCVADAHGVSIAYTGMCEDDDADHDLVHDSADNCLGIANWLQWDTDFDQIGNACDPDVAPLVNDCVVDYQDLAVLRRNYLVSGPLDTDFNGDGITDKQDLAIMLPYFFGAPGPSALSNDCE